MKKFRKFWYYLIVERNKILNTPFKYYNPLYRARLKRIDAKLEIMDKIDEQLKAMSLMRVLKALSCKIDYRMI